MTAVEDVTLMAATVATGLGAGVYYAYQVSVTRALAEADDAAYARTFQSINRTIVNPWFVSIFLGAPALAAAALTVHWGGDGPRVTWMATGLALNVASVAITVAGNIPLNEALDRLGAVSGEAATAARRDFERPWNRFHLARTIASVGGFVAFVAATIVA